MNDTINPGGGSVASDPGGYFPHQPVLYQEILNVIAPESGGVYLDGTLGAGGHAEGILKASAPRGRLLGLDLDPEALAIARQRLFDFQERATIVQASYLSAADVLAELGWEQVNGIILDLGVSSMQIDRPGRGFSFQEKGLLDMRFNQDAGQTAADLVNTLSEEELADLIFQYGEERFCTQDCPGDRRCQTNQHHSRPGGIDQKDCSGVRVSYPPRNPNLPGPPDCDQQRIRDSLRCPPQVGRLPGAGGTDCDH